MTAAHKRILYADDDPDDRELLSDVVRALDPDVEIFSVENGLEALEFLREEPPPSVIVLDLNMPFLSGEETFERIREQESLKEIEVIIFTSSQKPADKKYFQDKGVKFYSKPLDIDTLEFIAREIIEAA